MKPPTGNDFEREPVEGWDAKEIRSTVPCQGYIAGCRSAGRPQEARMIMWGCTDPLCIFCCGLRTKPRSKWSLDFRDGSTRRVCSTITFSTADFTANDTTATASSTAQRELETLLHDAHEIVFSLRTTILQLNIHFCFALHPLMARPFAPTSNQLL